MKRLEEILVEQGRKKQWLAQATGVSTKTITRYLNGETKTVPESWRNAAALVLGIAPEDLIDETPAPQSGVIGRNRISDVKSGKVGSCGVNADIEIGSAA